MVVVGIWPPPKAERRINTPFPSVTASTCNTPPAEWSLELTLKSTCSQAFSSVAQSCALIKTQTASQLFGSALVYQLFSQEISNCIWFPAGKDTFSIIKLFAKVKPLSKTLEKRKRKSLIFFMLNCYCLIIRLFAFKIYHRKTTELLIGLGLDFIKISLSESCVN